MLDVPYRLVLTVLADGRIHFDFNWPMREMPIGKIGYRKSTFGQNICACEKSILQVYE
jgi:hypothetical protein